MKKFLALSVAAVMLAMSIAGCGQSGQTSGGAGETSGTAASGEGKPLPAFTYVYNTNEVHQSNAEIFQDSWKQLGFDVNLQNQEWAVFQTTRTEGNYVAARHGWLADYSDPFTFLDLFLSTSSQNDPNFKSEEFDKLIEKARISTDPAERMQAMHDAEKLLVESYYVIPVYFYTDPRLDNGKVTGYVHDTLLNHLNFKWAKKEDGSPILYHLGGSPKSLDPALNNATDGAAIIQQCFDGLTIKDKDYKVVPGVAESWETSEDGLTWTFKLRQSNWSDGKQVTAHDFVYSWQRAVNPETAAEYAYQLWYIENAEAITNGEKAPEELGVKALDDYTLEVKLVAPCAYFTELTAFPTYYPVRKDVIEADPGWANNPATYVVNGAYKMTEFTQNDRIVIEKNDAYWDSANVLAPTVINFLTDDGAAALNAFETGEMDIIEDFPPEETARLQETGQFINDDSLGVYYVCLNADAPEMQDIAVRKAMALAIDREYVCEVAQQGVPAYAMVPSGLNDADGSDFREKGGNFFGSGDSAADLEEAKQILRDAGYAVP